MGNAASRELGGQEPDFSTLFVDGEAWNDAQHHASFLSKVQKCLLDPSFVSALQLASTEDQVRPLAYTPMVV
jgi:mannitol/fructose-specific phosphotransferase system IIA component (Ntr-type)